MTPKEQRHAFFDVYAANLTSCIPEYKDTFACPICRYCFDRTALDHPPSVILAHCVPGSLGGKLVTLVCAECDTESGRSLDKHAKTRFENEDFWSGFSPDSRRGWVSMNGLLIRADLEIKRNDDGTLQPALYADKKNGPYADFEAFEFGLESGDIDLKTTVPEISLDRNEAAFDWRNAQISIFRSAFLMMFRFLGYSYIFHPNVDRVWRQLLQPKQTVLPCLPIITLDAQESHGIADNRVVMITAPDNIRGFAVIMRFLTDGKQEHRMAVLMPGLDEDSDVLFDRVAEDERAKRNVNLNYTLLKPYPNALLDPNSCKFPSWLWQKYAPKRPSVVQGEH